jgi:hypothetical protein
LRTLAAAKTKELEPERYLVAGKPRLPTVKP